MASWEPDEIGFEDQYDKADPIDDANLDESINELNKSILEQEELESRIRRTEWSSMDKDERTELEGGIEEKRSLYIMRASKMILSILHRGFDKIKQSGKVMALDKHSAEKLYNRLRLIKSDKSTYKIAFENESGVFKDILSPSNRWLVLDDNTKQFTREFNDLPMNEDNQDNIMLQDIINKNEIPSDNSIKLIETSLTEIGVGASTQTGGLTFRELQGLDKELRTISSSLRSAIARSMAKQVDIDKENKKLEEMANDETYSDEQREEVRARLQRFQDEQKAINDQIRILKGRYSNQIYQIRESIMKFLDKETGTLGERIRTLLRNRV